MKKNLLLFLSIVSVLVCVFAMAISADGIDGIVANTITSDTYGTIYQLSSDPGLDNAHLYVSTLNTIEDKGKDTESMSILWDGTYYYVFPTSYLVDEYSNGKLSFTFNMSSASNNFSSTQKGINDVFSEWITAEGVELPTFSVTITWGSTRLNSLIRIQLSTDVGYIDKSHCQIRGDELVEVRFVKSVGISNASFLASNPKLTTVVGLDLLDGTKMNGAVFNSCTSLVSVKLPSNMTFIAKEMFYGCKAFTGIENWDEIKDNIKSIGDYAFYECDSMVSISLPSVTSIGLKAFAYSGELERVDLNGAPLVTINDAFRNCPKLKSLILPETVSAIGRDAFHGCSSLTYINVPRDCTELGPYCFNGCSSLEVIDMTNAQSLKSTGDNAFGGTKLKELIFPEGFESFGGIGTNSALTKLVFPNSTTQLKGMAWIAISEFTVPLGVTSLGSKQFDYCQSLKTVTIHKNVTSINLSSNGTFFGTSVTTIIYTGSEDDAVVEQIKTALPKATIVFADQCETYFGTHQWSGEAEMQKVDYFKDVLFADTCTREGCGKSDVDESRTISAMFIDYGYSATESAINGVYSMSQFYGINKDAIEKYRALTDSFDFGFVVAANNDPFGAIANGTISQDKVFVTEEKFFTYDYIVVSVGGISSENTDRAITFCVFVKDGDKVSYLDGGETVSEVAMKSYNDIFAIVSEN